MALCSKSWTDINIDFGEKRIKHCCKSLSEKYTELDKEFINNSPEIIQRRTQSLQGNKHFHCNYCWNHDSNSGSSYRDIYNKSINLNKTPDELVEFIELKFDNVCNLGCLYCSEIDSSTIAKQKGLHQYITKHDRNDVEIATEYIKEIIFQKREIRINMLGGEPTLSKGYHQFIQKLIQTNANDRNIVLITTSNGNMHSSVISILLDYMEQTNWVWVWGFSGEATKKVFENIRHGSSWKQWNDNLNTLYHHRRTFCISYNPTVNILSIKDFPNYIKHITKGYKPYYLNPNFVLQPIELSISKAPKYLKTYIEQAKNIFEHNNEKCLNKNEVYTWFDSLINTVGTQAFDKTELEAYLNNKNAEKNNTLDIKLLLGQIDE